LKKVKIRRGGRKRVIKLEKIALLFFVQYTTFLLLFFSPYFRIKKKKKKKKPKQIEKEGRKEIKQRTLSSLNFGQGVMESRSTPETAGKVIRCKG
jgi:hypothetical protein